MSVKAFQSAASAQAIETAAAPARARVVGGALGEAGSQDALAQLGRAMAELKALAVQPLLQRSLVALQANDWKTGGKWAQKALEKDERNGVGWYLLAIARERAGDFANSVKCYESALALLPEEAEVANDLGRLAYRMGMKPQAEKLFRHYLARHPGHPEAINNLACALRDQERYGEAIDTARGAIMEHQSDVQLWNTMGTIMAEQGDYPNAEIFFAEALRLDPGFYKSRYNFGNARLILGDPAGALEACEAALPHVELEDERQMMLLSRSTILMALGRIGEGWDVYEARLHPQFADTTHHLFDCPRWAPGVDLAGKSLLVCGEQGLGDEVLFSNVLPDVIASLGSAAHLTLAVEPRLVPLYRRTYPGARVVAHATYLVSGRTVRYAPDLQGQLDGIDLWTPMGSLLREFRRTLDSFPDRRAFITPDPDRVAHWRRVLEEQAPRGPKVGLLWKSAIRKDARHRYFSPFDNWAPVLSVEGASLINLQYGDCSEELALAEQRYGVRVWNPPGIDLKQDLDDVTALCAAMDLVIGFSNATLNLAAAAGAPTWLIGSPGAWTRLGTDRYPWYPQVRTFTAASMGDWDPVMTQVGEALGAFVAQR